MLRRRHRAAGCVRDRRPDDALQHRRALLLHERRLLPQEATTTHRVVQDRRSRPQLPQSRQDARDHGDLADVRLRQECPDPIVQVQNDLAQFYGAQYTDGEYHVAMRWVLEEGLGTIDTNVMNRPDVSGLIRRSGATSTSTISNWSWPTAQRPEAALVPGVGVQDAGAGRRNSSSARTTSAPS